MWIALFNFILRAKFLTYLRTCILFYDMLF